MLQKLEIIKYLIMCFRKSSDVFCLCLEPDDIGIGNKN